MRHELWPWDLPSHEREVGRYFRGELSMPLEVLLAVDEPDTAIGFAELSIRPYAEGCETDRVGFLEGWFVEAPHRGKGVGRALVAACWDWARAQGCTEFGSDADLTNTDSHAAHLAVGFEEANRIVCYRKSL